MVCCVVCDGNVCPGFSYFCRGCYREVAKQLPFKTPDLKEYLERSLGIEVKASYGWNFKVIHKTLLRQHPTLDKLAVLLEKVLFLKLVNCMELDLKANLANPFNDRVCCPRCGLYCGEPNQ